MPVKKTTTAKKTATKKPVAKRTVTKKAPAVVVTENAIKSDTCNTAKACCKTGGLIMMVLTILNTIILLIVLLKSPGTFNALESFEALRVGGEENYNIVQEIYELDSYKQDQSQRLQTTLDFLKNPQAANQLQNIPQPTQGGNGDAEMMIPEGN